MSRFNIDPIKVDERTIFESYSMTRYQYVTARLNRLFKMNASFDMAVSIFTKNEGLNVNDYESNRPAFIADICSEFTEEAA